MKFEKILFELSINIFRRKCFNRVISLFRIYFLLPTPLVECFAVFYFKVSLQIIANSIITFLKIQWFLNVFERDPNLSFMNISWTKPQFFPIRERLFMNLHAFDLNHFVATHVLRTTVLNQCMAQGMGLDPKMIRTKLPKFYLINFISSFLFT